MAILWACALAPEAYAAAGQQVVVPEQVCPSCQQRLIGWGGYWRWVRLPAADEQRLWIRRGWCAGCHHTHALLPAFLLVRRLDLVRVIGAALTAASAGQGLRPIAVAQAVPHTTVRGWWDRFRQRAASLLAPLLALAIALDPAPVDDLADGPAGVLLALTAAWSRAARRLGDRVPGRWLLWNLAAGGVGLSPHTSPPFRA
jgi:hypothetical protein